MTGADLEIDENAMLSRHEEDRITQAEKNKRMQEQLQVSMRGSAWHYFFHTLKENLNFLKNE